MTIRLKRTYEAPEREDGFRVLVDRLWPRGVSKGRAHIDKWLKDIAPSRELRMWFGHDPAKWKKFRSLYFGELKGHPDEVAELLGRAREGDVTLLYSASDREHNDAVALKEYLESRRRRH